MTGSSEPLAHPRALPPLCASRQGHLNLVKDLPFPELDITTIGHASHKATAVEVAAKGSVLLKNEVGGQGRQAGAQ